MHGFASGTYPFLKRIEPPKFLRLLAAGEIAVGSALLLPVVPAAVAGAALVGFSAGLLGLYVRTPGMRRGRFDPRSTPEGLPISKDVWMLGTGLGLRDRRPQQGRRGLTGRPLSGVAAARSGAATSSRSNTRIQPGAVAAHVSPRSASTRRSRSTIVTSGSANRTCQVPAPSGLASTGRSASTPYAPVAIRAWCCAACTTGDSDARPRTPRSGSRPAA